jgi:hypothetical protein
LEGHLTWENIAAIPLRWTDGGSVKTAVRNCVLKKTCLAVIENSVVGYCLSDLMQQEQQQQQQ